jgi:hypothetical protein
MMVPIVALAKIATASTLAKLRSFIHDSPETLPLAYMRLHVTLRTLPLPEAVSAYQFGLTTYPFTANADMTEPPELM